MACPPDDASGAVSGSRPDLAPMSASIGPRASGGTMRTAEIERFLPPAHRMLGFDGDAPRPCPHCKPSAVVSNEVRFDTGSLALHAIENVF
jgi:hypothetical protein